MLSAIVFYRKWSQYVLKVSVELMVKIKILLPCIL